jgi:flavin-binding protein dodecin
VRVELVPKAEAAIEEAVRRAVAEAERLAAPVRTATDTTDELVAGARATWRRRALSEGVDRDPGYASAPRSRRGAARA